MRTLIFIYANSFCKTICIFYDTDLTDNDDPLERKIPQNYNFLRPDFSLIDKPTTSEQGNDSEDDNLQSELMDGTFSSVRKQSMINSFFEPPFFKRTSKFNEFFLPRDTPLNI